MSSRFHSNFAMKIINFLLMLALLLGSGSGEVLWKFLPYTSQSNCLTVPGNSNSDLTTLSLATCTGSAYQKLYVNSSILYPELYNIQSGLSVPCSHTCLDVSGSTVVQNQCNPGVLSQYWVQASATLGNNYKNLVGGNCMTAGTPNVLQACNGLNTGQIWNVGTANGQGLATLASQQLLGTTCLEATNGNTANGASTGSSLCSSTSYSQLYNVKLNRPLMWKFAGSNKCLDGGGSAQKAYQYTCTSTAANHQWLAGSFPNENASGAFFYYVDLLSGFCLTWDPNDFTNVYMSTCTQGNQYQQWLLQATS